MINCNECFLVGTEVCKNKFSTCTIPATTDKCEYFITWEDAKEKIIHEKELPKIMKENTIRDAKEREERLRKEILSERFRLNQYYDEPWRFSIVNRFTDEQIENLIKEGKRPDRDYPCYQEDFRVTYGGSEEELQKVAMKEIKTWVKDTEEEIVELQNKIEEATETIKEFECDSI